MLAVQQTAQSGTSRIRDIVFTTTGSAVLVVHRFDGNRPNKDKTREASLGSTAREM